MPDLDSIRLAARDAVGEIARARVTDDEPLVSSGLIDSLSILTLISKLETRLGIRLRTSGLQPDDFDTIDLIAETVSRAQA